MRLITEEQYQAINEIISDFESFFFEQAGSLLMGEDGSYYRENSEKFILVADSLSNRDWAQTVEGEAKARIDDTFAKVVDCINQQAISKDPDYSAHHKGLSPKQKEILEVEGIT